MGRERELRDIGHRLRAGQNVLLNGDAGVGKTRLLIEIGQNLSPDMETVAIRGSSATAAVPLLPWLRWVPRARQEPRAILIELYGRSRRAPLLVMIDDAQTLDSASAALAYQMCAAERIPVLLAVRAGEPLPAAIEAVWRDELAVDLRLRPLDRRHSDELVTDLVGPAQAALLDAIWHRCRGHPLFVRELLRSSQQDGTLVELEGRQGFRFDPAWPARLEALVQRRLDLLADGERRLLATIELARDVEEPILASLGLLGAARRLIGSGFLSRDDRTFRVCHPLYGELALRGLTLLERSQLRGDLADALEASDPSAQVQVAVLRLEAGDQLPARLLAGAVDAALACRQPHLALRLAQAVDDDEPGPAAERLRLHAAAMRQRWPDAEVTFRRLVELSAPAERHHVHREWLALNFEFRTDPSSTLTWVEQTLSDPGLPADAAEWLQAEALRIRMFTADLAAMVADASAFLDERPRSAGPAWQVAYDRATALVHLGHLREASSKAAEALAAVPDGTPAVEVIRLRGTQVMATTWVEGLTEAVTRGRAAIDAADPHGPDWVLLAHVHLAIAYHDAGRPQAALELLQATDAIAPFATYQRNRSLTDGIRASALSMLPARRAEAEAVIDSTTAADDSSHWVDAPLLWLARSRLDHLDGRSPHTALDAGLVHARRRSCGLHEMQLLREMAHHGRASQVVDRVAHLADVADTTLARTISEEVRGLADEDGSRLHAAAVLAASLGATGIALDAATAAAAVFSGLGRARDTLRSGSLARHLAAELPGQRPAAGRTWEPVLTAREREVADAVVNGASNAQTADALHLSVRTVERHLYRVFRRVGVQRREELRDLVVPVLDGTLLVGEDGR